MIVGGPTGSCKTHFIKDLLNDLRVGEGYTLNVTLFYGTDQAMFDQMGVDKKFKGLKDFVSVVEGLQQLDMQGFDPKSKDRVHNVIIIDDLMNEVVKNPHVSNVITRGISHQGLTLIIVYQNLLPQATYARNIAMNAHYKACFYNHTTAGQFNAVVGQMKSGKQTLIQMYDDMGTHDIRGPLVIDCIRHRAWYGIDPDEVVSLWDKP